MVAAADRSAGGWWRVAALCDPVSVPLRLRVYFATTQGDSVFTKHKQPPAGAPHPRVCDGRPAGQSTAGEWTPGPLHTTQSTTYHIIAVHIPQAQHQTRKPPTPHTSLILLMRVAQTPNTKETIERTVPTGMAVTEPTVTLRLEIAHGRPRGSIECSASCSCESAGAHSTSTRSEPCLPIL